MSKAGGDRWASVSTAVLFLILAGICPAAAQVVTEFAIPPGGEPRYIAPGPGGMWFTETAARIGRITPEGQVTEFPISGPAWRIVAGPDGNLWFTSDQFLSRMTPDGKVTNFTISGRALGITVGPDGNIWFTGLQRNESAVNGVLYGILGRATLNGEITETLIEPWAADMAVGPDGNFWLPDWTEIGYDAIVRVTPSGMATRFLLPGGLNGPGDVGPSAVTAGPDGNVWFVLARVAQVGRITPAGAVTIFEKPGEFGIASGPDSRLWFTEPTTNSIGSLTTGGESARYAIPTAGANPMGISAGSDGNIWFTESGRSRIGKIAISVQRAQPRPSDNGPRTPQELPPRR